MPTTIAIANAITNRLELVKGVKRGDLAINGYQYENWRGEIVTSGFAITHVPSGHAIVKCQSVWKARRALRALLKVGSWQFPAPIVGEGVRMIPPDPQFKAKALKVVKRFRDL